MPDYLKKYSPLFFTTKDEHVFSCHLRTVMPRIQFVDGQRWKLPAPPICNEIPECHSSLVYLWDPIACGTLPFKILPNGQYQGPTSGVVAQYARAKQMESYLTSSDIGIGYDRNDERMANFVQCVWSVLKNFGKTRLASIDITTRQVLKQGIVDYIVGPDAKALAMTGKLLKHSSAEVYYVVDR